MSSSLEAGESGSSTPVTRRTCKLRAAAEQVKSEDKETRRKGLIYLGRVFYSEEDVRIITNTGIVPLLVDILKMEVYPDFQYRAVRILHHLGRNDIRILINGGPVPEFVKLLSSPNKLVNTRAVYALSMVARLHSVECMADITADDLVPHLRRPTSMDHATFIMLRIVKLKPIATTKSFFPFLHELLKMEKNDSIIKDCCKAVKSFSKGGRGSIEAIVAAGISPRLVDFLLHPCRQIKLLLLETIANISEGYMKIIDQRALLRVLSILSTHKTDTEMEKAVSRILYILTERHIIDADLGPTFLGFLNAEANGRAKNEAAMAFCNAICGVREEDIDYFVEGGCVKVLCDLLSTAELMVILNCLRALQRMVDLTIGNNKYSHIFRNAGMVDQIYKLKVVKGTAMDEVYTKGETLVGTYILGLHGT